MLQMHFTSNTVNLYYNTYYCFFNYYTFNVKKKREKKIGYFLGYFRFKIVMKNYNYTFYHFISYKETVNKI